MVKDKLSFFIFLFALIVQASSLSSQSLQTVPKIGLGINGLDFSVEIPVAKNITIEPAIGIGPSADFYEGGLFFGVMGWPLFIYEPGLHFSTSGKFFYNRSKRLLKGKSMLFNSGKFIGAKVKYVTQPIDDHSEGTNKGWLANVTWGGQRNLGRYWNYSYSLGVGYGGHLDDDDHHRWFFPSLDLKISYVLPFLKKT